LIEVKRVFRRTCVKSAHYKHSVRLVVEDSVVCWGASNKEAFKIKSFVGPVRISYLIAFSSNCCDKTFPVTLFIFLDTISSIFICTFLCRRRVPRKSVVGLPITQSAILRATTYNVTKTHSFNHRLYLFTVECLTLIV